MRNLNKTLDRANLCLMKNQFAVKMLFARFSILTDILSAAFSKFYFFVLFWKSTIALRFFFVCSVASMARNFADRLGRSPIFRLICGLSYR